LGFDACGSLYGLVKGRWREQNLVKEISAGQKTTDFVPFLLKEFFKENNKGRTKREF